MFISGPTKKQIFLNLLFFNNSIKLSYFIFADFSFEIFKVVFILLLLIEDESPNLKSDI